MEEDLEIEDDNMLRKPCRACPYRKKSLVGWLGASSPEDFVAATFGEEIVDVGGGRMALLPRGEESPMPCHLTINYEDPEWKEKWLGGWDKGKGTGSLCAGAAVMFANRVKLPRHIDLPSRAADRENIFTQPTEFIAHHRSGTIQSWDDDDDVE